jgi:Fe-S oxidoreductase
VKNPTPRDAEYLDRAALDEEILRVFGKCHDCRRCLPLCPSFPALFEAIDAHEQEAEQLEKPEIRRVVDLCFQCKLCYNHCPYHPPHDWMIDFPRLMTRAKIVQAREEGIPFADRMGNDQDRMGRMGCMTSSLTNALFRSGPVRVVMEKVSGIDRRWPMPTYDRRPFSAWLAERAPLEAPAATVLLFSTCFVEYSGSATARAAVQVLEHNRVAVENGYVGCCGAPYLHGGDLDGARERARNIVEQLASRVAEGVPIVVPGPTCSYQLKQEFPDLVATEEARQVAENTFDLGEYLWKLRGDGSLDETFPVPPGRVAYHLPCHLKSQNIGFRSRQLLRLAGAEVEMVDRCSGVDGTWGMKARWYEQSLKIADPLLEQIRRMRPDHVITDCPLAGLRIENETGYRTRHPVELLRDAYGLEDRP